MKEPSQIKENTRKKYLILYGICVVILLIAPIFFTIIKDPYTGQILVEPIAYFTIFLLGGWFGLISVLLAIYYLYYHERRRSLMAGSLGCCFIGFNFLFLFFSLIIPDISNSFVIILNFFTPILLFISLSGFCWINVRLYRDIKPPREKRAIEARSTIIVTIISILYVIFLFLYLIFLILMFPVYLYRGNLPFFLLLFGLIFITISLVYLIRAFKIQRSIVFGIIGIIFSIIKEVMTDAIYYSYSTIIIISLILMLLLNLLLLRYRKLEPTPLSERKKMIRESNLYDIIKRKDLPRDEEIKEGTVVTPVKKIKSKNIISAREVERRLTPEELEEKRKTESEVGVERKEFICVVHKGEIDGPIYLCPYCHTLYCQKCATALKEKNEKCWSCESEINI